MNEYRHILMYTLRGTSHHEYVFTIVYNEAYSYLLLGEILGECEALL